MQRAWPSVYHAAVAVAASYMLVYDRTYKHTASRNVTSIQLLVVEAAHAMSVPVLLHTYMRQTSKHVRRHIGNQVTMQPYLTCYGLACRVRSMIPVYVQMKRCLFCASMQSRPCSTVQSEL
eukprot:13743-Heterococcus_DN1.PRE.2